MCTSYFVLTLTSASCAQIKSSTSNCGCGTFLLRRELVLFSIWQIKIMPKIYTCICNYDYVQPIGIVENCEGPYNHPRVLVNITYNFHFMDGVRWLGWQEVGSTCIIQRGCYRVHKIMRVEWLDYVLIFYNVFYFTYTCFILHILYQLYSRFVELLLIYYNVCG